MQRLVIGIRRLVQSDPYLVGVGSAFFQILLRSVAGAACDKQVSVEKLHKSSLSRKPIDDTAVVNDFYGLRSLMNFTARRPSLGRC